MGDSETGQVSHNVALVYEEVYLPALFLESCCLVVEAADVKTGHRVIDMACGTGALAIIVSDHIGPREAVFLADINEEMLNVAKSRAFRID